MVSKKSTISFRPFSVYVIFSIVVGVNGIKSRKIGKFSNPGKRRNVETNVKAESLGLYSIFSRIFTETTKPKRTK